MAANKDKNTTENKKSYAVLCKPENLTRNNYFSDTYTAVMTVNGEKKAMDITHISLPFRANRSKAIMKYFDLSKSGMDELKATIARCITNQVNICNYLNKKNVGNIMQVVSSQIIDRGANKKDIYLVTEHLRPITEVYFNEKTTLYTIFKFASRIATLIRDIHQINGNEEVHMRAIDPEQIFVDDGGMYVFGSFQYAYLDIPDNKKEPLAPAETAPLHIEGKVQTGAKGNIGTDMHTLASVMWSLLNGDGFDRPTPTGTPPKYATQEMTRVLELGLGGDPEMFPLFKRKVSDLYRSLINTEDGRVEVPVPLPERCVDTPLVELDMVEIVAKEVPIVEAKEPAEPAPTRAEEKPVVNKEQPAPVEEPTVAEPEPIAEPVSEPVAAEPEEPDIENEPHADIDNEPHVEEDAAPVEPVSVEDDTPTQEEQIAPDVRDHHLEAEYHADQSVEFVHEDIEEESIGQELISVYDASKYVETHDSEYDVVTSPDMYDQEFEIYYHKPVFFFRQALIALALMLLVAAVLFISVYTHFIPLW